MEHACKGKNFGQLLLPCIGVATNNLNKAKKKIYIYIHEKCFSNQRCSRIILASPTNGIISRQVCGSAPCSFFERTAG